MRPIELQPNGSGPLRCFWNAGMVLAMGSAVAIVCQGCEQVTCDELHDPACWIPPVTDASGDVPGPDAGAEAGSAIEASDSGGDSAAGEGVPDDD